MAIVKLLKAHNGQKAGTIGELNHSRADYLVRNKIAEYVEGNPKQKTAAKKAQKKDAPCLTC